MGNSKIQSEHNPFNLEFEIQEYPFSIEGRDNLTNNRFGCDYSAVYFLYGNKNAYVGETNNLHNRISQHLDKKKNKGLSKFLTICHDTFNKSAILDIERELIQLFTADQKFTLINGNLGQSSSHNYFNRAHYLSQIDLIWNKLKERNLAIHDRETLLSSEIYKFSPYKRLTDEQLDVAYKILIDFFNSLLKMKDSDLNAQDSADSTCIVKGSAGTGKTILAIHLLFLLRTFEKQKLGNAFMDGGTTEISNLYQTLMVKFNEFFQQNNNRLKICLVYPMKKIREHVGNVFKTIDILRKSDCIGPNDVVEKYIEDDKKYDLIIVDEAHRLCKYKQIQNRGAFKNRCIQLGLNHEESNQLDWIIKSSKYRVLFFDEEQTVRGSDIAKQELEHSLGASIENIKSKYELKSQMRCAKAGQDYPKYISDILNNQNPKKLSFKDYPLYLFDDFSTFYEYMSNLKDKSIQKDKTLVALTAGYCREWKSEDCETVSEIKRKDLYDFNYQNGKYKLFWNLKESNAANNKTIDEVFSVHTTQGFDLNYVGVIIGKDLYYDKKAKKIKANKGYFFDKKAKEETTDNQLFQYIVNAYKVLLTRGMDGCYIYVEDDALREYLKSFIDLYSSED